MNTFVYGSYILMWPVMTLGVLALICGAVIRDSVQARKDKKSLF